MIAVSLLNKRNCGKNINIVLFLDNKVLFSRKACLVVSHKSQQAQWRQPTHNS
jgi:hypothetical protein